jgi:hypothetical protein
MCISNIGLSCIYTSGSTTTKQCLCEEGVAYWVTALGKCGKFHSDSNSDLQVKIKKSNILLFLTLFKSITEHMELFVRPLYFVKRRLA